MIRGFQLASARPSSMLPRCRMMSTKATPSLPMSKYFKPSQSLEAVKEKHAERRDLPDRDSQVQVAGRIIGRRKASGSLLFLDLEANGETL